MPAAAFTKERLALARQVRDGKSLVEIYENLGKDLNDAILYANGVLEYEFQWGLERRSIVAQAEQTYEVINLTRKPYKRAAFWENSVSDRFALHRFECWSAENRSLISKHYAVNPLQRTPDGTRVYFEEEPVEIPPLNEDGSGRIYCRARWSLESSVAHKDTINSMKHAVFNRRIEVIDSPDDISVTLTGLGVTRPDPSRNLWLIEGLTLPGDTHEVAWAPRS